MLTAHIGVTNDDSSDAALRSIWRRHMARTTCRRPCTCSKAVELHFGDTRESKVAKTVPSIQTIIAAAGEFLNQLLGTHQLCVEPFQRRPLGIFITF
jgi:hypothetical protein